MNISNDEEWLIRFPAASGSVKMRLICFPFAGGGTSNYAKWRKDLHEDIELCAFNLPGRERFFSRPCLNNYQDLINRLTAVLQDKTDCPMIFFGHSFGGLSAWFTALALNKIHPDSPVHTYISARRPPQRDPADKIASLAPEQFKHELIERYQGIPKVILDAPELLDLFLPIIQSDFKMYEQYSTTMVERLEQKTNCGITSIGYAEDRTKEEDMYGWQYLTRKTHRHIHLPGGHFEILNNWKAVTDLINQEIV